MKTFICALFLVIAGIPSAFAQSDAPQNSDKKGRDRLFPDFAKDVAKLEKKPAMLKAKPQEGTLTTPQALKATIFKDYRPTSPAPGRNMRRQAAAPAPAKLPSTASSAEAAKLKPQAAKEQPKPIVPDQNQK